MPVHRSYLGSCTLSPEGGDPIILFCTDMSFSGSASPAFYDHTYGLLDAKVLQGVDYPIQKKTYRYTNNVFKGSVSGSLSEGSTTILQHALLGTKCVLQMVFIAQGTTITLSDGYIESMTVNINAGEIATFSMEFTAATSAEENGAVAEVACTKLLTWDVCLVSAPILLAAVGEDDSKDGIASLTITVNNKVMPIFTAYKEADAIGGPFNAPEATELRLGIQEITGNISTYNSPGDIDAEDDIVITLNETQYNIHVTYAQPALKGSAGGLFMSSTNFFGVSPAEEA